jgi:hypothetical protein
METLAVAPACRHSRIRVETRGPTEFIDLTDGLDGIVSARGSRTAGWLTDKR